MNKQTIWNLTSALSFLEFVTSVDRWRNLYESRNSVFPYISTDLAKMSKNITVICKCHMIGKFYLCPDKTRHLESLYFCIFQYFLKSFEHILGQLFVISTCCNWRLKFRKMVVANEFIWQFWILNSEIVLFFWHLELYLKVSRFRSLFAGWHSQVFFCNSLFSFKIVYCRRYLDCSGWKALNSIFYLTDSLCSRIRDILISPISFFLVFTLHSKLESPLF